MNFTLFLAFIMKELGHQLCSPSFLPSPLDCISKRLIAVSFHLLSRICVDIHSGLGFVTSFRWLGTRDLLQIALIRAPLEDYGNVAQIDGPYETIHKDCVYRVKKTRI